MSHAGAHSAHLQAENGTLWLRVSSLTAQLTAAQQSSAFFKKLFFCESKKRSAAVRRAEPACQQGVATGQTKAINNRLQKQDSVGVHSSLAGTDSATAGASASTAAASLATNSATDTIPTASTKSEFASARTLATAHKLRLSAEARVRELSSENASLRDRLMAALAQHDQAQSKIDRQNTAFAQAHKMCQRAEEDLSGVAAERNQLQRVVSDLTAEQARLSNLTISTAIDNDMPDAGCLMQTLHSGIQATPDHTARQTPIETLPQALALNRTKEFKPTRQTHDQDSQISAVHAGQNRLQDLHEQLESKEEVIQRQAADITDAAVKMSMQQGKLHQLQAALRSRELAALLFHVRLVPTRVSSHCL